MSSENKEIAFRNRDANSAINIRNLFRFYLENRKRHDVICRNTVRSSPSKKVDKVEQSVDFTKG